MKISELRKGMSAYIERYGSIEGFSERLMELGLTPGTLITVARRAPFGGPIVLAYGHSRLALRPSENDAIYVRPL